MPLIVVEHKDGMIEIKGHSGYSFLGTDIICSAVSALFQNMVGSIQELTGDWIEVQKKPGDSYIKWKNISEQGNLLIRSFLFGVREISMEYPEYVSLVNTEKDSEGTAGKSTGWAEGGNDD